MIFELPIEHFPPQLGVQPETSSLFSNPLRFPVASASCKDMCTALEDTPSVSCKQDIRPTLKVLPRRLAVSELRLPRVSISIPPVARMVEERRPLVQSWPMRIARAFSLPSLSC